MWIAAAGGVGGCAGRAPSVACLSRRGVDPGGDEGDASPPAIGVGGGWTIQSSPPGFTNDFKDEVTR